MMYTSRRRRRTNKCVRCKIEVFNISSHFSSQEIQQQQKNDLKKIVFQQDKWFSSDGNVTVELYTTEYKCERHIRAHYNKTHTLPRRVSC